MWERLAILTWCVVTSQRVYNSLDCVHFSYTIIPISPRLFFSQGLLAMMVYWQSFSLQRFKCNLALFIRRPQGSLPRLLILLLVWHHWDYCRPNPSYIVHCVQTCRTRWESILEDTDIDYEQGAYIHCHTWNSNAVAHIFLHSKLLLWIEYNFITVQLYMVGLLPEARICK